MYRTEGLYCYCILKMWAPHTNRRTRRVPGRSGLTLEEAQAFCSRDDSGLDHNRGQFFYGYEKTSTWKRSLRSRRA